MWSLGKYSFKFRITYNVKESSDIKILILTIILTTNVWLVLKRIEMVETYKIRMQSVKVCNVNMKIQEIIEQKFK